MFANLVYEGKVKCLDELYLPICTKVIYRKNLTKWTELQLMLNAAFKKVNEPAQKNLLFLLFGEIASDDGFENKEEKLQEILDHYINNMRIQFSPTESNNKEFNINV